MLFSIGLFQDVSSIPELCRVPPRLPRLRNLSRLGAARARSGRRGRRGRRRMFVQLIQLEPLDHWRTTWIDMEGASAAEGWQLTTCCGFANGPRFRLFGSQSLKPESNSFRNTRPKPRCALQPQCCWQMSVATENIRTCVEASQ